MSLQGIKLGAFDGANGATPLSIMTLNIMTLSIKGLYMTELNPPPKPVKGSGL
jgi:hypothetical protein